ncbi:DUF4157 domain-containing protein [Sphingomonas sp. SUN019]|uniref:eCIS core domain-containing protein n=1 Tax=Sphingomonas sp. SUN019 TaxID=2937788 RepID=UPI002164DF5C|nr:DUF4157 domain-containing protein [Sphingomonas sp. SUN019]UVO51107.1 DUF4157 domain-containing protein [Sphingomonas sp. SUN019]
MAAAAARLSATAETARSPDPGRTHRRVQTALKISHPNDASEREAESTARTVMTMPGPVVAPRERVSILAARAPAAAAAKPRPDETSPALTAAIEAQRGGGRALSADTRSFMEPRFKADFSGVRIHTDGRAENLATRLGARAFTYGRDIFFNASAYQPDTPEGMELIAHELTHTIQQREVVQREVIVAQRTGPQVQRGIISEALDWIADKANMIPGFRLFTIVIGRNPINMEKVARSGANILRALIEFIPGGGLIVQALENHGIFEKGGKFIEEQFAALGDLGAAMRDALMEFIDSLGWRDIFRLGSLWSRAKRIFSVPVDKAIDFGRNLVTGIAKIVKDAIIKPLGRWAASNIPHWDLLVGVFGKNPISDEGESPASALIGGFMKLIGQEEIWENIKKGNAVAKAWAWFQGAMKGALSLVTSIPGRVMDVIRSLTIFDIVTIAGAFKKIFGAFASFVGDFFRWAGGTVFALLEIILSVVAPTMVPYLKKAGAAFNIIIKAPGTFIATLVAAGKMGFNLFKKNIVAHLKRGLIDWLLGSLAGANLYIPKSFELRELLKFGLSVVGLTWANVRGKLVKATNETVVSALEEGFDIVKTLVTEGPAAAWQQLLENLSNLKSMVMDAIMDYVKQKVIEAAIEKVVSMLNPAGAFIQAILAIYRTITFIVDKLKQIGALVAAFIDGVSALARGLIAPAATRVETVLATGLSLAISFLASFAGLGNVSKKVIEIVNKIRAPVDKALDKVVDWIVAQARRAGRFVAQVGVPHDPNERLKLAGKAAILAAKNLSGAYTVGALNLAFAAIRTRYGLTSIAALERGGEWSVRASINPEMMFDLPRRTEPGAERWIADRLLQAARTQLRLLGRADTIARVEAILTRALTMIPNIPRGSRLEVVADSSGSGTVYVHLAETPPRRVLVGRVIAPNAGFADIANPDARGVASCARHIRTRMVVVKDARGGFLGPKVVRDISGDDARRINAGQSMLPKEPVSRATMLQHTEGVSSNFISTSRVQRDELIRSGSRDPSTGRYRVFFNPRTGRVEINLFRIKSADIIDLSNRVAQEHWGIHSDSPGPAQQQAMLDTVRTMEVLVRGEIPSHAIRYLGAPRRPPQDDPVRWP